MRRAELEHVIRAAAYVAKDDEIVVVGSQAVLGEFPDAPDALLFSLEADIYPRNHPERAIDIDGALGDGSHFHETYGYYAHGVGPETAKAPASWTARLIPVRVSRSPAGEGQVTGWCLEVHDLVLAKCAAGRERDWEFAEETIRHGLASPEELLRRARELPVPEVDRERVQTLLGGIITRTQSSRESA